MGSSNVIGIDFTLPAPPPLRKPPLSLLDLAVPLIAVDEAVGAAEMAHEAVLSAQADVSRALDRMGSAPPEAQQEAAQAAEMARTRLAELEELSGERAKALADAQRWEDGFEWLPELSVAEGLEIFVPYSGEDKRTDSTRNANAWYDPFEVVAHDNRSLFGYPAADQRERAQRAARALMAHEAWEAEREFWTGERIPTNYHLTASAAGPTSSARRDIDPFPDPTPAPTTNLTSAVGIRESLAALDQAIANSDAGTGMIHATPYLVQLWSSTFPFLRDSAGRIYTVNFNLIVPGYGYPATGPDIADRTVTDGATTDGDTTLSSSDAGWDVVVDVGRSLSGAGIPAGTVVVAVTNGSDVVMSNPATATATGVSVTIGGSGGDNTGSTIQWAYATDTVYKLTGATRTIPDSLREMAPLIVTDNSAEVRAERSHALITNQLLRAAVLVDTTTA